LSLFRYIFSVFKSAAWSWEDLVAPDIPRQAMSQPCSWQPEVGRVEIASFQCHPPPPETPSARAKRAGSSQPGHYSRSRHCSPPIRHARLLALGLGMVAQPRYCKIWGLGPVWKRAGARRQATVCLDSANTRSVREPLVLWSFPPCRADSVGNPLLRPSSPSIMSVFVSYDGPNLGKQERRAVRSQAMVAVRCQQRQAKAIADVAANATAKPGPRQ
jgi:hypothetical protein